MKQQLTELKRKIDKSAMVFGDFLKNYKQPKPTLDKIGNLQLLIKLNINYGKLKTFQNSNLQA